MGRIARILSFARALSNGANVSDVKIDAGGGANSLATHTSTPGDDSYPLRTDYAVLIGTQGSGEASVIGYVDPLNEPQAAEGEKRIYARDSAGSVVSTVWLKNDGSIELEADGASLTIDSSGLIRAQNGLGFFQLDAAGVFNANGFVIDPSGAASGVSISADSVVADGKELANHLHLAGDPPGNTGPNI